MLQTGAARHSYLTSIPRRRPAAMLKLPEEEGSSAPDLAHLTYKKGRTLQGLSIGANYPARLKCNHELPLQASYARFAVGATHSTNAQSQIALSEGQGHLAGS
jgi:hypothetical protein